MSSTHRLLCLAALVSVAGCKCGPTSKFHPIADAGPECDVGMTLVQGACRFVCHRDGDCPTDQRCNLLTGMCEAKPAPVDAGPESTPCTNGAVRCTNDAKGIESCDTDGGWALTETCPVPDGFCQNEVCLTCQPGSAACVPNTTDQLQICLDDGSGFRNVQCATGALCTMGECRECIPNSTQCSPDGKSLQTCTKQQDETDTWHWVNSGDNLDGTCITQMCTVTAGMAQCVPPSCFPGTASCVDSTTQQVCGTTGSYQQVSCLTLPDGGTDPAGECQNGVCVHECADAVAQHSYFGCDYWGATLDNSVDNIFKGGVTSGQGAVNAPSDFAFVATNRSTSTASVTVSRWYSNTVQTVTTVNVPGRNDPTTHGLVTINVPWQSVAQQTCAGSTTTGCVDVGVGVTAQSRYGYRVQSTRPITLYQMNPMGAAHYGASCNLSDNDNSAGPTLDCKCAGGQGGNTSNCQACLSSCFPGLGCFGCVQSDIDGIGQCAAAPGGGNKCVYYAFSNDASLLLPAHDLGTQHVAVSQEHSYFINGTNNNGAPAGDTNGYITVVGTQDNTSVTIKSSAVTVAGTGITAMNKGDTRTFTLNSYDVLQLATNNQGTSHIECNYNPFDDTNSTKICRVDNDLTGTVVTSTAPVALFGGSACTLRPYDRVACDHIEEQIFPFTTWGKTFVSQRSAPYRLANGQFNNVAPDHWKIVASCSTTSANTPCPNGTTITFSTAPSSANVLNPNRCLAGTSISANNCRLAGGSYMEFKSTDNFTITADFPIAVAQIFPGEGNTSGLGTDPVEGDPSLVLLPPIEQWRASYTVLAAPDVADNYLGISVDSTKVQSVSIDGTVVQLNTFTTVAGSNYVVRNYPVSTGPHTIDVTPIMGVNPLPGAGVTVFGYDSYVSYGYTGGLDLQTIVSGINPGG